MNDQNTQSQWSRAALNGIALSLFTVLPSLLSGLITDNALSIACWFVKTTGSLWILFYFMRKWAYETGATNAFGYGFKICLFSSLICSLWTFILVKYITPDIVQTTMDAIYQMIESQPSISKVDAVEDMLMWFEENFAQFNAVSTLSGCILYGLMFSGIFGKISAIHPSEANNQEEEEL